MDIQIKRHNREVIRIAESYKMDLFIRMTSAEHKFLDICKNKGIIVECQYIIYVTDKGKILRFYIADFCDIIHKIVFEIDGGYHDIKWQKKKDSKRTKDLEELGYKVYRLTNKEVFKGKAIELINKIYK